MAALVSPSRRVASIPSMSRHPHVHDDDVGVQRERLIDGLGAVAGLADDLHVLAGPRAFPAGRCADSS